MLRKILSFFLVFSFIMEQSSFAQVADIVDLSAAFSSLSSVNRFRPIRLRSLAYDRAIDDFRMLLDKGDTADLAGRKASESAAKLLQYFQVGLVLPDSAFWVNLRPDGANAIIDPMLEKTDVGRIFLETDLALKKDLAASTLPSTAEGRKYWEKLYAKAEELFGTREVSIPTMTRPWIVPGEIIVRRSEDSVHVYKAGLQVRLEQERISGSGDAFDDRRMQELNEYATGLVKDYILPGLVKRVNSAKMYAPFRQVYYSLILAKWYKQYFQGGQGEYAQRIDSRDLSGLTSGVSWSKDTYFNEYRRSLAAGEYTKSEHVNTVRGTLVRRYASGGIAEVMSGVDFRNPSLNVVSITAGRKSNRSGGIEMSARLLKGAPANQKPEASAEQKSRDGGMRVSVDDLERLVNSPERMAEFVDGYLPRITYRRFGAQHWALLRSIRMFKQSGKIDCSLIRGKDTRYIAEQAVIFLRDEKKLSLRPGGKSQRVATRVSRDGGSQKPLSQKECEEILASIGFRARSFRWDFSAKELNPKTIESLKALFKDENLSREQVEFFLEYLQTNLIARWRVNRNLIVFVKELLDQPTHGFAPRLDGSWFSRPKCEALSQELSSRADAENWDLAIMERYYEGHSWMSYSTLQSLKAILEDKSLTREQLMSFLDYTRSKTSRQGKAVSIASYIAELLNEPYLRFNPPSSLGISSREAASMESAYAALAGVMEKAGFGESTRQRILDNFSRAGVRGVDTSEAEQFAASVVNLIPLLDQAGIGAEIAGIGSASIVREVSFRKNRVDIMRVLVMLTPQLSAAGVRASFIAKLFFDMSFRNTALTPSNINSPEDAARFVNIAAFLDKREQENTAKLDAEGLLVELCAAAGGLSAADTFLKVMRQKDAETETIVAVLKCWHFWESEKGTIARELAQEPVALEFAGILPARLYLERDSTLATLSATFLPIALKAASIVREREQGGPQADTLADGGNAIDDVIRQVSPYISHSVTRENVWQAVKDMQSINRWAIDNEISMRNTGGYYQGDAYLSRARRDLALAQHLEKQLENAYKSLPEAGVIAEVQRHFTNRKITAANVRESLLELNSINRQALNEEVTSQSVGGNYLGKEYEQRLRAQVARGKQLEEDLKTAFRSSPEAGVIEEVQKYVNTAVTPSNVAQVVKRIIANNQEHLKDELLSRSVGGYYHGAAYEQDVRRMISRGNLWLERLGARDGGSAELDAIISEVQPHVRYYVVADNARKAIEEMIAAARLELNNEYYGQFHGTRGDKTPGKAQAKLDLALQLLARLDKAGYPGSGDPLIDEVQKQVSYQVTARNLRDVIAEISLSSKLELDREYLAQFHGPARDDQTRSKARESFDQAQSWLKQLERRGAPVSKDGGVNQAPQKQDGKQVVGGIDIRGMELTTQTLASTAAAPAHSGDAMPLEKLAGQWQEIRIAMLKGGMPYLRIRDHVIACSGREDTGGLLDEVTAWLAETLMSEEEQAAATCAELKEILMRLG